MNDLYPHQKKVLEFFERIKAEGTTPTGRFESKEERERRALEKLVLFPFRYGTGFPRFVFDLEMNFSDVEQRLLAAYPTTQQIPKDLLRNGTLGTLYGTRFITDSCSDTIPISEYTPPPKDFNKCKTNKEQLEARLTRKKGKPSSLLSKLVSKK